MSTGNVGINERSKIDFVNNIAENKNNIAKNMTQTFNYP